MKTFPPDYVREMPTNDAVQSIFDLSYRRAMTRVRMERLRLRQRLQAKGIDPDDVIKQFRESRNHEL